MIGQVVEQVLLPLGAWALLMALASGAGLALVGAWPWATRARDAGVALAAGLAAAPLLAGLATVIVLWALPGAPARTQGVVIFALLALAALAGLVSGVTRRTLVPGRELVPHGFAAVLTWGFFVALLLDAATVPLIQNDALEYATVGSILFDTRDLASYPVLQAAQHPSGFYGPWTHPPLYVALLDLGFLLQGGSERTMLMRLVAPWCLAGAALCVAALARWANPARPNDGSLAALLLVSTPLLFLGAASALIDAFPVLGLTLAFTAVAALAAAPPVRAWLRPVGIGVMLGLALWTHSQAVLFPLLVLPLLLAQGAGRWTAQRQLAALATAALALVVAGLVGGAPYVRNVALFGSPISDNPLVFTLPSLDWASYFRLQRGLGSAAEVVQYGLLKPWFAIESYALVFWLALLVLWQRRQPLPAVLDASVQVRPLALALVGLYLAGALLAVLLGIDLMVRNERYMLILLPAAAIVAAGAMSWPRLRGTIVLLIGLQLAVLVLYRLGQLNAERVERSPDRSSDRSSMSGEDTRLHRWGPYGAVAHLRRDTPPASVVFSMKPADMLYAGRTMVSYLDPRLLPFYAERQAPAAAGRLRELGVTHVHMPDYWLPPVYNSALQAVLADPGSSELSFEANGYQVYRLLPPDAAPGPGPAGTAARAGYAGRAGRANCGPPLSFTDWQRAREFVLGGRKNLRRINVGAPTPFATGEESRSWNTTPLFLRETNTVLRAEVTLPPAVASPPARPGERAAAEWLLQLELAGEGYVQALVRPRGAGGMQHLVADQPLVGARGPQVLQRRLRIDAAAQRVELRLEHRADSRLRVADATLIPLCAPMPLR